MRETLRPHAARLAAAAFTAAALAALAGAARADGPAGPLAGVVTAGTAPVAGVELLVHGLSSTVSTFSRIVKTAPDGTWVIPAAPAGLYAVSSLARGFRPAVARFWHRAQTDDVSFVTLKLERPGGVLPASRLGDADPWLARAITTGDVFREEEPAGVPFRPHAASPAASSVVAADLRRVPLHASVASTTGFGSTRGASVSATSVDLGGTLGSFRWGVGGEYRRLEGDDGGLGNASHLTVDVAPGNQSIRLSARDQRLELDDDPALFAAQAIDWSGAMGDRSRASVSARLVTESNLLSRGPVSDLFARASNAFEVEGRYRAEAEGGNFVRFAVGYRTATAASVAAASASAFDRETHVGGAAGVQVTRGLSVEAGATGDVSTFSRGVMPELTVTIRTPEGIRFYGFFARRFEQRLQDELPLARAGTDEAGLSRLSRSAVRAGVRWDGEEGASVSLEASRRELLGTYRLLLDPDFLDHLDSLYFLDGDVALELSGSTTFRVAEGLQGRLSARTGRIDGERPTAISRDHATYTVASAALRVGVTKSLVSVGYRVVSQELERYRTLDRNELSALDFSLAQSLPVPFLRALGTEWQALLSLELGQRLEADEIRANRRLSGGLALTF